jgi:hypothetical protein
MALRGWRILSKKSKDLLGSQTPLIRKVKIQNKGIILVSIATP